MFTKITDSFENRGNVRVKLSFFLEPTDDRYDEHHVYVVDETCPIFQAGYHGKADAEGNSVDDADYEAWLDTCRHIWRDNPFHNHFINVDPKKTDADIKALAKFHAPNFYESWKKKKTMRSGWAVETRIKPIRYDEKESSAKYAIRKGKCEKRAAQLKELDVTNLISKAEGRTFPATDIDIGNAATNRGAARGAGYTHIDSGNPANDTGILDTFEVWFHNKGSGVKIGTFSGSGSTYTNRDYESIGAVTAGSKQSFTGLSCDVTSGDFIGIYFGPGYVDVEFSGGTSYYKDGDQFGAGAQSYSSFARIFSIYGSGETVAEGWTGKVMGVTNPAKIMGVAVADIKKVMGVE